MNGKTRESFDIPIIRVLRKMGGEGRRSEVISRVAQDQECTEDDMGKTTPSGRSTIALDIEWARWFLARNGYLLPTRQSGRGIWALSEMGRSVDLESIAPGDIIRHGSRPQSGAGAPILPELEEGAEPEELLDEDKCREELLARLRKLPSRQFEFVCKNLLEEMGFIDVGVTPQASDGGFDGVGYLKISPLVKTKVIFECKRYQAGNSVNVDTVRGLQAAIESQGKGEKGVIITTSDFTIPARQEAESGKTAIELINGDDLADLFVEYELGVKYTVDDTWFRQFADEKG